MIEKIVERSKDGGIEKILERKLTTLEETVALAWPHVKRLLRQPNVAHLQEVQIEIGNIPATIDPRAVADMLCDKIIAEPDGFADTKWQRISFVFGARR